jgi:polyisoprenoid-binding protein YceI
MATYDATTATCLIFVYRDGLLARLGHDLKLRVERFAITVTPGAAPSTARIEASLDTRSLRAVCFREDDADSPRPISAADRAQIERNAAEDVLDAARFPEATLTAAIEPGEGPQRLRGTLTLRGRSAPVEATVHTTEGRHVATVELCPSRFGIAPYRALLGALRVQDRVTVVVSVPAG